MRNPPALPLENVIEESLWAGEPADPYPSGAIESRRKLQRLVLAGKTAEARDLGLKKLTMSPTSFRSYQPLAHLWIELDHPDRMEDLTSQYYVYSRQHELEQGL